MKSLFAFAMGALFSPILLTSKTANAGPTLTMDKVRSVSPALERYTKTTLLGEVWKRPQLKPRDRSLITVAALIARNQTIEIPYHINLALGNGVKPSEISELITHLAFYAGWANAMSAVDITKDIFYERKIGQNQLPAAEEQLLEIEPKSEAERAAFVEKNVGPISPGLVHYTGETLFHDLWLRPALTPRDRSLITVASLIANGQSGQLSAHLNRAMDNGLTKEEVSEILTHLPFYTGWPNVFSAIPVVKEVIEKRTD